MRRGTVVVVDGASATGAFDVLVGSATAAGKSSTTFVSRSVGTTRTAIATTAITLSTPTYTRGQRQSTHESSAHPANRMPFTTSARVLWTAEVNALGWTISMTTIPPNSTTWGTAKSTQRFTPAPDR